MEELRKDLDNLIKSYEEIAFSESYGFDKYDIPIVAERNAYKKVLLDLYKFRSKHTKLKAVPIPVMKWIIECKEKHLTLNDSIEQLIKLRFNDKKNWQEYVEILHWWTENSVLYEEAWFKGPTVAAVEKFQDELEDFYDKL
ncbi:hypothetical protein ZYGNAAKF_CDS0155 [Enterococcus phage VRE9_2]